MSGNNDKCPFCNSDVGNRTRGRTHEDILEQIRKRVAANDATSMIMLAKFHSQGMGGLQQDQTKAEELYARAAELGSSKAHYLLSKIYRQRGDLKKAKFHLEVAAMAGHEVARNNLGSMEGNSGNMERALKHLAIAASAGCYDAMQKLRLFFEEGFVSRDTIDSTLKAYNSSCAEMRSEARDASILAKTKSI
jgi:TPR repeat protein